MINVAFTKFDKEARVPEYKTSGAAGADIYALDHIDIKPGETEIVRTGIGVQIPPGFEMQIRSRSGMAAAGIVVANSPGTIDSDYRGEIKILLHNYSQYVYPVSKADRIAQAVFNRVERAHLVEVSSLSSTERGAGGLGSTGRQ